MTAKNISITADEIREYFAAMMNSIRESEGHPAYTAEEIAACWNTMHDAERIEWEDEALFAKIERIESEG